MRLKLTFLALGVLLINACGPGGGTHPGRRSSKATPFDGTTGYSDYVHGGDQRVEYALRPRPQPTPAPAAPGQKPPLPDLKEVDPTLPVTPIPEASEARRTLAQKLREFEITRFEGDDRKPTRFGTVKARIRVFFRNEQPAEFISPLVKKGDKLSFEATQGRFKLSGEITDSPRNSLGKFTLIDSASQENAEIFYRAYRAKLNVREDRTRQIVAGSGFEKQLKSLRENTFGWVHNWTVLRGPSFYLVDIVRIGVEDVNAPVISFKGESRRTGDEEIQADSLTPDASEVRLVGNSEQGSRRMFSVTLEDKQSAEKNTVMVDIEAEDQEAAPPVSPDEVPIEYTPPPSSTDPAPEKPGVYPNNPNEPKTSEPRHSESPELNRPIPPGNSYLQIDNSLPRTALMTRHFNRNQSIPGVRNAIADYQRGNRLGLERFYTYAHPFRRIMEAVGSAYDVSPAYAYLTVIESAYFTGGKYVIQRPYSHGRLLSSALGPFQILEGTAQSLKMRTGGQHDERRYFTTSACGAAKYIGKLVNIFDGGDSTLSILAYYQGEGAAAAAIYCSLHVKGSRSACANRIGRGMTGAEYERYLRLAKNYSYSYAELERVAAIPFHMRNYVNKKLAVYFISSDLKRYGFDKINGVSKLPSNGTVTPPHTIQDPKCRSAINSVL